MTVAWNEVQAASADAEAAPWTMTQEPDWDRVASLRVLSAEFNDGSRLAFAGLRPAGAAGHGEESVGAVLRRPNGEEPDIDQPLVSVEYGADELPRRVTLELVLEGEDVPLRGGGDVSSGVARQEGAAIVADLNMRLAGTAGTGELRILTGS